LLKALNDGMVAAAKISPDDLRRENFWPRPGSASLYLRSKGCELGHH
jgi:hypothetical protein